MESIPRVCCGYSAPLLGGNPGSQDGINTPLLGGKSLGAWMGSIPQSWGAGDTGSWDGVNISFLGRGEPWELGWDP